MKLFVALAFLAGNALARSTHETRALQSAFYSKKACKKAFDPYEIFDDVPALERPKFGCYCHWIDMCSKIGWKEMAESGFLPTKCNNTTYIEEYFEQNEWIEELLNEDLCPSPSGK